MFWKVCAAMGALFMEPPVQLLALATLVVSICALLWLTRARSRQPEIAAADATSAARHKQPLQAVDEASTKIDTAPPRAADKRGHLQQCIARCLQSTCGCLSANTSKDAAPKSPPPELAPSTAPLPLTRHSEAATLRSLQAELAQLRLDEPDLARAIESISDKTDWLQCFLAACGHSVEASTALVRSYASLSQDFKLEETKVADILSAGLIEILPDDGGEANRAVVAVVRDIQIIGRLLQTHSFHDVVAAHLVQLQRLLTASARARQYGISMVHDLSTLSLTLVRSMLDPRNLHAQLHGARFLFTAFPVRFHTIVVVDAPPAFGVLLNAVKAVAPGAIPKPLEFVSRPEAVAHCERVFGQPVLRVESER